MEKRLRVFVVHSKHDNKEAAEKAVADLISSGVNAFTYTISDGSGQVYAMKEKKDDGG